MQSIYLSCSPDDWEATRELRDALDAAEVPFMAHRPEAIATAWRYVACFSREGNGVVRYDRQELLIALDRPRLAAGQRQLIALKLRQCHLPVLPVDWRHVPTIGPTTDWNDVVKQIVQSESDQNEHQGRVTTSVVADEAAFGRDLDVTTAELSGGGSTIPDAHTELKFGSLVVDRDGSFKTVVNHGNAPKRK